MKNLLIYLSLLGLIAFFSQSCAKDQESEVKVNYLTALTESNVFKESKVFNKNHVDLTRSTVTYLESIDSDLPILSVLIAEEEKIEGIVEGFKVPKDERHRTYSGKDEYLLMYKDYSDFDFKTISGKLRLYDVNFSDKLIAEAIIEKGSVIKMNTYGNPKLKNIQAIPCDTNGNGNLGYSECTDCFHDACENDPECNELCLWADVAGILVTGAFAGCSDAILIACAYLSIVY